MKITAFELLKAGYYPTLPYYDTWSRFNSPFKEKIVINTDRMKGPPYDDGPKNIRQVQVSLHKVLVGWASIDIPNPNYSSIQEMEDKLLDSLLFTLSGKSLVI